MKIWKQDQINELNINNQELKLRMSEMIAILDDNYGVERDVNDLGGYILWIQDSDKEELNAFLEQYPILVPEYVEISTLYKEYQLVEMLFLLSSDYSVVVYCDYELIKEYPAIMSELNINE